jgi:hypothetical protein
MNSTTTWPQLQQQLAEHLNIYPTSLHAVYRLSTDDKKALPCDLISQQHFDTLIMLLRKHSIPPRLASGHPSTQPKKHLTIQVFNKTDGPTASDPKVSPHLCFTIPSSLTKHQSNNTNTFAPHSASSTQDTPKSDTDIFHEKKKAAQKAITDAFACAVHSLPDKLTPCWKGPDGFCYPITESNLNYWSTLHVSASLHVRVHNAYE